MSLGKWLERLSIKENKTLSETVAMFDDALGATMRRSNKIKPEAKQEVCSKCGQPPTTLYGDPMWVKTDDGSRLCMRCHDWEADMAKEFKQETWHDREPML